MASLVGFGELEFYAGFLGLPCEPARVDRESVERTSGSSEVPEEVPLVR